MWWPFAKRGTRIDATPSTAVTFAPPINLGAFAVNNACIKLWLPEKLIHGLDTMSAAHGMSRPDVLRWLLFEHVYGRPALEKLKEWKRQKDAEEAQLRGVASEVMYSPKIAEPSERRITTQLLGKSVEDFKLLLPAPLKVELGKIATAEDLGLSDYLRKTLVRILLGEGFHHQWRTAVGKLPDEVQRFEQDQTI